jgi:hypothetical protein
MAPDPADDSRTTREEIFLVRNSPTFVIMNSRFLSLKTKTSDYITERWGVLVRNLSTVRT